MVMLYIAFATIFITICTSVNSIVADISRIIVRSNEKIERRASIKREFKEIIGLHLHCFRYDLFLNLNGILLSILNASHELLEENV